jgi:hypothetical protein
MVATTGGGLQRTSGEEREEGKDDSRWGISGFGFEGGEMVSKESLCEGSSYA